MEYQRITAYAALCTWCAIALFCFVPPSFAQNEALVEENTEFKQRGYFTARQDLRRCPFPHCGGYWVKRVNHQRTRCVDGRLQKECYVAEIKGVEPKAVDQLLLRGKIKALPTDVLPLEGLGVFVAKEGFVAASSNPPTGTFVGLADNGVRCITAPCPHYDEFKLNSARSMVISSINLEKVGADDYELQQAIKIPFGGVLLAAGVNKQEEFPPLNILGITFHASQFYLPLKQSVVDESAR